MTTSGEILVRVSLWVVGIAFVAVGNVFAGVAVVYALRVPLGVTGLQFTWWQAGLMFVVGTLVRAVGESMCADARKWE